jgi:hypothetical protein
MERLDRLVQLGVLDHTATPPLSPTVGDRYIVAVGGTGAWAGHDGAVTTYTASGWSHLSPKLGWQAYVAATQTLWVFDSAWSELAAGDVSGPSSAVDGNVAVFNGTSGADIADSGKALSAGDVVGTTDTQVLTNKTINGVNNTLTVRLNTTDVTGDLPVTHLNGGTGATASSYWRGDGTWAIPAGGGGGSSVTVSDVAPASAITGDLWWCGTDGQLYVWIGAEWVAASNQPGSGGGGGTAGVMSLTTVDGLASDTPTGDVTVGLICPVEVEDGGTGATDLPVSPGPGTMGLTNTLLSANGINPIKPISSDAGGTVGAWDGGQLACIGVSPEGGIELMSVKGSLSSPTALAAGDNLGSIWFTGFAGSDFGVTAGQISCSATENWTDTAQGTQFTFDCTVPGTTNGSRVLTLGTAGATLTAGIIVEGQTTLQGATTISSNVTLLGQLTVSGDGNATRATLTHSAGNAYLNAGASAGLTLQTLQNFAVQTGASLATALSIGSGGNTTINASNATPPLTLTSPTATNCELALGVTGARSWTVGNHSTGMFYLYDSVAGYRLQLTTTPTNLVTGGSWATISDAAIKQDVTDYTHGLDEIIQLRPVQFTYSGSPFNREGEQSFGLIAQEVEVVLPELVGEYEHNPRTVPGLTDEEREEITDEPIVLKTLDHNRLVFALVNSIRELNERLSALESKL